MRKNLLILSALLLLIQTAFAGVERGVTAQGSTYTPTLTNTANLDSSTTSEWQYLRVGNTVTTSGRITMDPTAAAEASTTLGITIPIASNFGAAADATGACTIYNVQTERSITVEADSTNDRFTVQFLSDHNTEQTWSCHVSYQVI